MRSIQSAESCHGGKKDYVFVKKFRTIGRVGLGMHEKKLLVLSILKGKQFRRVENGFIIMCLQKTWPKECVMAKLYGTHSSLRVTYYVQPSTLLKPHSSICLVHSRMRTGTISI